MAIVSKNADLACLIGCSEEGTQRQRFWPAQAAAHHQRLTQGAQRHCSLGALPLDDGWPGGAGIAVRDAKRRRVLWERGVCDEPASTCRR